MSRILIQVTDGTIAPQLCRIIQDLGHQVQLVDASISVKQMGLDGSLESSFDFVLFDTAKGKELDGFRTVNPKGNYVRQNGLSQVGRYVVRPGREIFAGFLRVGPDFIEQLKADNAQRNRADYDINIMENSFKVEQLKSLLVRVIDAASRPVKHVVLQKPPEPKPGA